MAVEIPVVIDIDKAFNEAASKIPQAIKPLQSYMDANALQIKLQIADRKKLAVKDILEDATLSAKNLERALADIEAKINKKAIAGGFDLTKPLQYSEKILLEAYGALEAKANKVTDASQVMAKIYSINLDRAKAKVTELSAKIDVLTKKQNTYAQVVEISGKKELQRVEPGYSRLSKQLDKTNADLKIAKQNVMLLSSELAKVSQTGKIAAASIGTIKTAANQMVASWERGATYVERYNAALGVTQSRISMLIKSSLSLIALHAATKFVRNIREVTSEFEMQRVALGGIIQDTERAEKLFRQIKAAAIQSPFEIKDLVSFTKQLSAYRIETESLFDVTMKLADISAGLGVDMSRLVLAYGQVRAASVLRGQELRQFTEAGIPLVELLAEKFTTLNKRMVSTAEVFDLISKRAVPFKMIEEIFDDMTSAGGIFYKMQEKQSETLKGQWMKLKDALSIMYDEIGNTKTVHGAMESLLKDAMQLLQNWREVAKNVKVAVAAFAAYKVAIINARIAANALTATEIAEISALQLNVVSRSKVIAALFGESAATKVQIALGNAYVAVKQREMMATNLFSRALYRLVAALLANPYAIAIAGAAALIAILVKLSRQSKEATITTEQLQKAITGFEKAKSHARDIEELCDAYDKLSKKADKTKEEEERLAKVTKDLAKSYPSAIKGANEHTKAIELDTKAIRERNTAVKEAIKLSLQQDKEEAEAEIENLESEYARISEILARGTIKKAAYGGEWFEPITDEQREKFVERLLEIEDKIDKFGETVNEAETSLEDFKEEFVGPPLPEFFGDAWRAKLNGYVATLKTAGSETRAFNADEIQNFENLRDALEKTAKLYKEQTELVETYTAALETATGSQREQLLGLLGDATTVQKLYGQILTDYNAWDLVKDKDNSKGSYQKDPFIERMQERIKFMQDFKKGYDDLSNYLSSKKALDKQASIMQARGLSLGVDPAQQRRAAEDLSGWYQDAINDAFEQAKKYGATGTVESFLSQVINDQSRRGKALKDFQELMQSLWDAATDFDLAQTEQNLEKNLKELSDNIKKSEVARNFYNNMLDLTGDEELAANLSVSVYGGIGDEFKERIQKQLLSALETLGADDIDEALLSNIKDDVVLFDTDAIRANLDKLPPKIKEVFDTALTETEKYNADWLLDFEKNYGKAMTYAQRVSRLEAQRTRAEQEAAKMGKSPEEVARVTEYYNRQIAQVQLEAMKDTYTWTKAFEDLDGVSTLTLNNLIDLIDEYVTKNAKYLEPQQQKELTRAKEQAEAQKIQRNAYQAVGVAIGKLFNKTKAYEILQKNNFNLTKAFAELSDDQQKAIKDLADALSEAEREINEYISSAKDLMSVFATSDDASYFGEQLDNLSKAFSGVKSAGIGIAQLASGVITPQAIQQTASGVASIVSSIFGAANAAQTRKVTKEIDYQNRLVEDLEESYDNLSRAMDKAFGNDYVYNYSQQLENLIAQQEAYQKQVDTLNEASSSAKTKKKKEEFREQAQEAEKEVRKVGTAIDDLKNTASSFFAGEDLSSAAESFADAWLSAYQEFGDTSQAIEERMTEMVQNIVKKAALSGIVQNLMGDWYRSLAEVEDWNAATINQKLQEAYALVDPLNQALTGWAQGLQAEGTNLRQMAGQFTGIKRDIAGASEESINGLAAGINTQNFYMSYISQNVAAILTYLTGGTTVPASTATGAASDPYKDTVLLNLASLPQMRDDLYEIRRLLSNVIKPTGTTATHYVSTNL